MEPVSARRAAEAKLSLGLVNLACRYMNESFASSAGRAYFAAAIMGMAAMETLLIIACIADKAQLQTSKAWTSYRKHRTLPFGDRLLHIDLSTLVKIAQELKWFTGAENRYGLMKQYEGWEEASVDYPEFLNSADAAIEMCTHIRNLIHAGQMPPRG